MPRPNKKLLFLLVIIGLSALIWAGIQYLKPVQYEKDELYIQSGTRMWPFAIEVAKTKKQREKGLMMRRRLPPNYGMLFEFGEPQIITMWMKNTLVPLDMVFINAQGVIVHIEHSARPRSEKTITYGQPATGVLELPGGAAKRREIEVGDLVIHPYFDLAAR